MARALFGANHSLRSKALGSSGHKKKRAREKKTRAPPLSFAHYFQAPDTHAQVRLNKDLRESSV